MDPWDIVEADRLLFADYLGELSAQEWDLPTWCDEWSVKGVAVGLGPVGAGALVAALRALAHLRLR